MTRRGQVAQGQMFGRLQFLRETRDDGAYRGSWFAMFKCFCGKEFEARMKHVKAGSKKSCGCARFAHLSTGGKSDRHLYAIWFAMKRRCLNETSPQFADYGGRGITVCDEWLSYKSFEKWAFDNGWKRGIELDRKDNDAGYCPENCRFVTRSVNIRNRRDTIIWKYQDKVFKTAAQGGEHLGISDSTFRRRCRSDKYQEFKAESLYA